MSNDNNRGVLLPCQEQLKRQIGAASPFLLQLPAERGEPREQHDNNQEADMTDKLDVEAAVVSAPDLGLTVYLPRKQSMAGENSAPRHQPPSCAAAPHRPMGSQSLVSGEASDISEICKVHETDISPKGAACAVVQSSIAKASFLTTQSRMIDHFYHNGQRYFIAKNILAKKLNKSSSVHPRESQRPWHSVHRSTTGACSVELDWNDVTADTGGDSISDGAQRGLMRIFYQKGNTLSAAPAERYVLLNRLAPEVNTTSQSALRSTGNCAKVVSGDATAQAPRSSYLLSKADAPVGSAVPISGGIAVSAAGRGPVPTTKCFTKAAVLPTKKYSTNIGTTTSINNNTKNEEHNDNREFTTPPRHADPLGSKVAPLSQITAARLALKRQTMTHHVMSGPVTPASAAVSSRCSHPTLAAVGSHHSGRRRAVFGGMRRTFADPKSTEGNAAIANSRRANMVVGRPSLHRDAASSGEVARFSSPLLSSSTTTLRLTDFSKPDVCKLQPPSSRQQLIVAKRSCQQTRNVVNLFLSKYSILRMVAKEMNFNVQETERELDESRFNLCWSDTVLPLPRLVRLGNWQRTNHFPSMFLLCRKSHLSSLLGCMKRKMPSDFQFYPNTWSLNTERYNFTQHLNDLKKRRAVRYFIAKPNAGSQGRGIVVTNDPLSDMDNAFNFIVQEYIYRPLLFEGRKFDLRVYVLLMCIREPSIFMFNNGLVRLCTEPYEPPSSENSKNMFKHLTNYAINKVSANYVFNTDVGHSDVGNKRDFKFINRWLEGDGHSIPHFWEQVGSLAVKTIMAAQPRLCQVYNACFPGYNEGYTCFEVLGFDVLIDCKLKAWLLEVNHTPSFATDTPLDLAIKEGLLREIWDIVDCKATDLREDRRRQREEFTRRNIPLWTKDHTAYSQWYHALSLMRQKGDGAGSGGPDTRTSSVLTRAVDQGYNNNGAASVFTPKQSVEKDAELFAELVRLHREREDEKLVNFTRIYPSSNAELQNIYDRVRSAAEASFITTSGSFKSNHLASPQVSLPASKTSPLPLLLETQQPQEVQRPATPLAAPRDADPVPQRLPRASEMRDHRGTPDSVTASQAAVLSGVSATVWDVSSQLSLPAVPDKQLQQKRFDLPPCEKPVTNALSPIDTFVTQCSGIEACSKADSMDSTKVNAVSLSNAIEFPTVDMISAASSVDDCQNLHSTLLEANSAAKDIDAHLVPALTYSDTLALSSPDQQPLPNHQKTILDTDVPRIQPISHLPASHAENLQLFVHHINIAKFTTSQSGDRKCSLIDQFSRKKSRECSPGQEPGAGELHCLEDTRQHFAEVIEADPEATEFESFDLSD